MVAGSMFYSLNNITNAEFGYFTLNMQTTREIESNVVSVQYRFSKRFLGWCKILVLYFPNCSSLVIIFRLFYFSLSSHDATPSVLSSYFHSCPVPNRKFFPS